MAKTTAEEFKADFLSWIEAQDVAALQDESQEHRSYSPAERVEQYLAQLGQEDRSRVAVLPQLDRHLRSLISA